MSAALTAACLWVLASSITAMLPMRLQYVPGFLLLVMAPPLLIWIGAAHGPVVAGVATLAWISLFRHPIGYLIRRTMTGKSPR